MVSQYFVTVGLNADERALAEEYARVHGLLLADAFRKVLLEKAAAEKQCAEAWGRVTAPEDPSREGGSGSETSGTPSA